MPESAPAALDARRRRLLYRATHRGTGENDVLLGGVVTPRVADFRTSELDDLEHLLDLPDPDLTDWLSSRRPTPPVPNETFGASAALIGQGPNPQCC